MDSTPLSSNSSDVPQTTVHSRTAGTHGRHQPESAKVALKRTFPLLEFSVHAVALAIIAGLIAINVHEYLWKGLELKKQNIRNMQLKAFQFGAKVHEVLMVASLSFVVFYYMRKLLVGRDGIPFGLISAPHITSSPSMLIKPSFWAGFWHHRSFGALLFATCILSFAVGPSSAITMIPSLGWFEKNSAFSGNNSLVYYTASPEALWPTVLNASTATTGLDANETIACQKNPFNPSNLGCPTAGFLDSKTAIVYYCADETIANYKCTLVYKWVSFDVLRSTVS
jgi:hypothetical protein